MRGSCLCGAVRFEVDSLPGPFELCHCSRCRRSTGSAFAAGIWVKAEDFRFVAGQDRIEVYEAPILQAPPPYRRRFCRTCGSPVPDAATGFPWVEVQAGLLEGDPGIRPDKHLVIGPEAPWYEIRDELPRMGLEEIARYRAKLWF
jgi:hypothetical protein